jgi:hypothetical protein
MQQISENNATKKGFDQVVRELFQMRTSLQLVVTDINLELNKTSGEFKPHCTIVTLYSHFTIEAPC